MVEEALDIMRKGKCLLHLENTMEFLEGEDRETLQNIFDRYKKEVDAFNIKNVTVTNPTKSELGSVNASYIKVVRHHFLGDMNQRNYNLEILITETKLPEHIISAKILLARHVGGRSRSRFEPLEIALSENIRTLMIQEFINQNPNYETN